jgi:hypothetical protein
VIERAQPDLEIRPKRPSVDAWRIRRSKYEHWLEDPDTFFVVAVLARGAGRLCLRHYGKAPALDS